MEAEPKDSLNGFNRIPAKVLAGNVSLDELVIKLVEFLNYSDKFSVRYSSNLVTLQALIFLRMASRFRNKKNLRIL